MRLSQYRGKSAVVVYFYPKDDTSVCTKQACSFRDQIAKFETAGAVVLGISDDSVASHGAFKAKYGLPFLLLSDRGGVVRKLFGVAKRFGVLPGRVTFVIDRDGVVRRVYSALGEWDRHVAEALGASLGQAVKKIYFSRLRRSVHTFSTGGHAWFFLPWIEALGAAQFESKTFLTGTGHDCFVLWASLISIRRLDRR